VVVAEGVGDYPRDTHYFFGVRNRASAEFLNNKHKSVSSGLKWLEISPRRLRGVFLRGGSDEDKNRSFDGLRFLRSDILYGNGGQLSIKNTQH
jgi:hypothetical protein